MFKILLYVGSGILSGALGDAGCFAYAKIKNKINDKKEKKESVSIKKMINDLSLDDTVKACETLSDAANNAANTFDEAEIRSHIARAEAYKTLDEILDSNNYKFEEALEKSEKKTRPLYSQKEIETMENELAEAEAPSEDEYYDPEDDMYDHEEAGYILNDACEYEDFEPPYQIDEDEYEYSNNDIEQLYYYSISDTVVDSSNCILGGKKDVVDMIGPNFVKTLEKKFMINQDEDPIIFVRNEFLETDFKITYINLEYVEVDE